MCSAPLRELSNPGASGSIFYLTDDDEFIIKTVQHKEGEFLQKLLPGYYMNLNQNPRTLLPKFFGLYCFQCNSKNVRLIVMNNLLPSYVKLHLKYDLKGSTYNRKVSTHSTQYVYDMYTLFLLQTFFHVAEKSSGSTFFHHCSFLYTPITGK